MLTTLVCFFGITQFGAGEAETSEVIAGSWAVNCNGFVGELVLNVDKENRVEGKVFNAPLKGSWDAETQTIRFKRLEVTKSGSHAEVQAYTGQLARIPGSKPARYTLDGTFVSLAGPRWGDAVKGSPWKAEAIRHQPASKDLSELQGSWQVVGITDCLNRECKFPDATMLNAQGSVLTFQGNQVIHHGQVVATLTNDIDAPSLAKELGFSHFRLLVLTLPNGKGLVCSYLITDDHVEIAYPHTTSCHRGSGQITYLKRSASKPESPPK
jgi:hypothetical protein